MINNILENSILDRATKAFQNNDGGRKKVLHFLIFFKSVLFAKIGFKSNCILLNKMSNLDLTRPGGFGLSGGFIGFGDTERRGSS